MNDLPTGARKRGDSYQKRFRYNGKDYSITFKLEQGEDINKVVDELVNQKIMSINNFNFLGFSNIRFYEKRKRVFLNAEDVARELGLIQVKNKVEYVKWDRLKCYLKSINAKLIDRNGTLYIREADFYMLSMTVRNEKARNFQYQLAHSILPNLRKTGDEQPKLTANLENSKDFLDFIKEELSPDVYKKLLSEYKKQS